jgi:glyoxylase-like metal-dependent hydrolase (beta-lactamase superfamily II)
MIEELYNNIFQIKLPFPRNPLRDINIYVVRGKEKSLMIDNGINLPECCAGLLDAAKKINLDLTKTEFFLTHMHVDHSGNLQALTNDASVVYMGRSDMAGVRAFGQESVRDRSRSLNALNGVPAGDITLDSAFSSFPLYDFAKKRDFIFHFPEEGQVISAAGYNFKVMATPGHSKGHICLYEPAEKLFFCGDHILGNVTPIIFAFAIDDNPLGEYLSSLDKVYDLDAKIALPGHREPVKSLQKRIDELKHHHGVRANEALQVLDSRKLNAYQIAGHMHWDVSYENWEQFPYWQRVFATSETFAHLRYLVRLGKVAQENGEREILFSRV